MGRLTLLGAGKPSSGGAPAFSPTDISGLQIWLKADAITGKVDGDAISQWDDSTGLTHHAVQATGSKQPLYKTGILNGKPAVRFDGTDDFLRAAFTLAQPEHVFIVARYRSANISTDTLIDGGNGADNYMRVYRTGTGLATYAGGFGPVVTLDPEAAFHAYSILFSGASSEMRVDGGTAATGNVGTSAADGITVGGGGAGAGSFLAPVDVAEVILYDSALSSGDRISVEGYLATKYAL